MHSYWAYILVGDDRTGKTSFQKHLIAYLCEKTYERLDCNLCFDIVHPRMPRGVATLSAMNRSFSEKIQHYKDVSTFFSEYFEEADVCILSSHAQDPSVRYIRDMIRELKLKAYNVAVVFFSNSYDESASNISLLDWDERLWIDNGPIKAEDEIQEQLAQRAKAFGDLLISRASYQ
jgi:hypothetical protein